MTRFLKLIIEPIFVNDPELGPVDITRYSSKGEIPHGSQGSGEYLFNLDAILADATTKNLSAGDSSVCSDVEFIIGDQQSYQGIKLAFGKIKDGDLEIVSTLFNGGSWGDAKSTFDEEPGATFGDITNIEQATEAVCAANRIFSEALLPKSGNTKLASILSSRDFKGKVYDQEGELVELVGWGFEVCEA